MLLFDFHPLFYTIKCCEVWYPPLVRLAIILSILPLCPGKMRMSSSTSLFYFEQPIFMWLSNLDIPWFSWQMRFNTSLVMFFSLLLAFCLKVCHFVLKWAGTDSNPFSLDAFAVFMYRVLQRVNHPVCSCRSFSYFNACIHSTYSPKFIICFLFLREILTRHLQMPVMCCLCFITFTRARYVSVHLHLLLSFSLYLFSPSSVNFVDDHVLWLICVLN